MDERQKKIAIFAGVLIVLAFVIYLMVGRGATGTEADHPEGFKFVCGNGHEFTLSMSDLVEHKKHPADPIKCPKCGDTNTKQAGVNERRSPPNAPQPPKR